MFHSHGSIFLLCVLCLRLIFGLRSIKLPVAALLHQFKENSNPLIRHFDLLYIQQGLERLSSDVSILVEHRESRLIQESALQYAKKR